jgi:O-antigen/teichoic acid export membrane protein
MNFAFSEEQEELRKTVRSFLESKSPESEVRRLMDTEDGYDPAVWSQMGEQMGLQGLAIPEEFGGSGYSFVELGVVLEEMGRALLCAPYFSTVVLAANTLLQSGDDAAKKDFLPGIAAGETIATLAYLRRSIGLRLVGPSESLLQELKHSPEIVSYSAYIYVVVSAYSLTQLATRYFVFSRLGTVDAGLLQAILSVALTVGAVLAPMSGLYLTPLVNRQMPVRDKVRAASDFAGKILVLLLLASLPVILFPRLVLTILFSGKFAPAAEALFIFVLWQCLYQVVNVYQQLLIGLDDMVFVCVAVCLGCGSAVLLTPLLVHRFGLGGAALALTVGMTAYGAAAAIRLRRRFASGFPPGFLWRTGYVLAVVVLSGLILRGSTELAPIGITERVAFASVAVGVFWLLLSPDERGFVRSGLAMLSLRRRAHP